MKRLTRGWAAVMVAALLVSPLCGVGAEENLTEFAGGDGTAENPYRVETFEHLGNVRNYPAACFVQTGDIDATAQTEAAAWVSIANVYTAPFTGVYDGGDFRIVGLKGGGLFGFSDGVIRNVHMADGTTTDAYRYEFKNAVYSSVLENAYCAGSVVGRSVGTVENCSNTGSVSVGTSYVGGVVGISAGTLRECYNTGSVSSGGVTTYSGIGGVVGSGTATECWNTGDVTGSNPYHIGGVVGSGTAKNCYNAGAVSMNNSGRNIGGIVGSGSASGCYNKGSVSNGSGAASVSPKIGGIAGGGSADTSYNEGDVTSVSGGYVGGIAANGAIKCYNKGRVSMTANGNFSTFVGGIVADGGATDCYNTGEVYYEGSSGRSYVGGIAGSTGTNNSETTACYNTGNITSSMSGAGGIAGGATGSTSVSSSYFLDTTAQGGVRGNNIAGAVALTAEQMRSHNSFSDFANYRAAWDIRPDANDGPPTLLAFKPFELTMYQEQGQAYCIGAMGNSVTFFGKNLDFYAAVYNAAGRLLSLQTATDKVKIPPYSNAEKEVWRTFTPRAPLAADDVIRVFAWDGLSDVMPYCGAYEKKDASGSNLDLSRAGM
ncbi:hypothetical protein FACS189492_1590 [Clostridia bacterium]|nr:hypothetical protein FACS189492_1590 [Clostridia bacterium]